MTSQDFSELPGEKKERRIHNHKQNLGTWRPGTRGKKRHRERFEKPKTLIDSHQLPKDSFCSFPMQVISLSVASCVLLRFSCLVDVFLFLMINSFVAHALGTGVNLEVSPVRGVCDCVCVCAWHDRMAREKDALQTYIFFKKKTHLLLTMSWNSFSRY